MKIEYKIRVLAGTMILISLGLGLGVSQWWFILTAFVGLNLIQSAFTGFCPPEILLRKWSQQSEKNGGGCCCVSNSEKP